jgi:hypothetical protein
MARSNLSVIAAEHPHECNDQDAKADERGKVAHVEGLARARAEVITVRIPKLKNHPQESGQGQPQLELEDTFSRQHSKSDQQFVRRQSTSHEKQMENRKPAASNRLNESVIG